ncbi:MAG: glycosyltransferase [Caldilineaceae bacterium]
MSGTTSAPSSSARWAAVATWYWWWMTARPTAWQVVDAVAAERNTGGGGTVVLVRRCGRIRPDVGHPTASTRPSAVTGADIVTWMDCDLSMPPEDIPKLVQAVLDGADMAAGFARWIPGGADVAHGPVKRTSGTVINRYAMALLGSRVHDYTSGFIAGRAAVFDRLRLRGDYGSIASICWARSRRDSTWWRCPTSACRARPATAKRARICGTIWSRGASTCARCGTCRGNRKWVQADWIDNATQGTIRQLCEMRHL